MWIHLNDAFFSIVADPARPEDLLVRARVRGDIERLFPLAIVTETPHRDYRFRAWIPRLTFAAAIAERVAETSYPNFKASVPDPERHLAYARCWSVMHGFQQDRLRGEHGRRTRHRAR